MKPLAFLVPLALLSFDAAVHAQAMCDESDVQSQDLANAPATEPPPGPWPTQPQQEAGSFCGNANETLSWRLINCERTRRHIAPLKCDLRLVWLGRRHSSDMVRQHYFSHITPEGLSPFDRMEAAGIRFQSAGENIALNSSITGAHTAWMNSPGHRQNILSKDFTYTGVGLAESQESWGRAYDLTQDLLRPAP
jgi:uncharacterized protein YkwD